MDKKFMKQQIDKESFSLLAIVGLCLAIYCGNVGFEIGGLISLAGSMVSLLIAQCICLSQSKLLK